MGGGTKRTRDAPKGPPIDLLAAIAEAGRAATDGLSVAEAGEFCSQMHDVPFRARGSGTVAIGDAIRLVLGEPVSVIAGRDEIGVVEAHATIAMRGCLSLGYEMSGSVTAFDSETGLGRLSIVGQRRQVA